jgi:hypothetical protein
MWEMISSCNNLVGMLERKGHGPGWENNIGTEIKEIGCENVDWIQLAHDWVQ